MTDADTTTATPKTGIPTVDHHMTKAEHYIIVGTARRDGNEASLRAADQHIALANIALAAYNALSAHSG